MSSLASRTRHQLREALRIDIVHRFLPRVARFPGSHIALKDYFFLLELLYAEAFVISAQEDRWTAQQQQDVPKRR